MKKSYNSSSLIGRIVLFVLLFSASAIQAQVGIGTTNPNASSALDITSTTQGLLLPRMTTAQRNMLRATAANSLMVYDTDLKSFYYFDATALPAPGTWVKINAATNQRNNYVLVKSAADLPPPISDTITLLSNTYYEINGTITLTGSINLNNAYVAGLDPNEDVLSYPGGTVFAGNTGGSIRNITIKGARAFNITGPGISTSSSLLVQNTIIDGMTSSVGTISGLGLYFGNIVQFINNKSGITYENIGNLLLNNQAWLQSNEGIFETLKGTFGLVEKASGFSSVPTGATGLDVSATGLSVGNGVLLGTVFSGAGIYVKGYAPANTYPGYNFTNAWSVNCPGIPRESDDVSSGNIYYNGTITTGFVQTVSNGNEFNLSGTSPNLNTTTAVNLFRVSSPQNNRLTYLGKKTRTFQINASLSVRGNSGTGDYYAFFIKKNGAPGTSLVETNTLMRVNNTSDISSNSISGTVELAPNDYIEIWGQRLIGNGTTSITVFSLNVNLK